MGALPVILDEPQHAHLEELGLTIPKVCSHILVFTSAAECVHQVHDSRHLALGMKICCFCTVNAKHPM